MAGICLVYNVLSHTRSLPLSVAIVANINDVLIIGSAMETADYWEVL